MAGKKGSKTSKTDHVLNLISGMSPNQESASPPSQEKSAHQTSAAGTPSGGEAPAAPVSPPDTPEAAGSTAQPAPAPYRAAPILEVARTNHEALSETVHQALENALEEELRQEQEEEQEMEADSSPPETGAPAGGPQEEPAPPQAEQPPESVEPLPEKQAAPEPVSPAGSADREEAAAPAKPSFEEKPSRQKETDIVNVMQILVSENLERYVNMFQLCRCSRCLADVQALALTNLPAKYVVMDHGKLSSMLGYYRHRYATEVMIELTKACNVVKQHPHHDL